MISKFVVFLYKSNGEKEIELSFLMVFFFFVEENGYFKVLIVLGERFVKKIDVVFVCE